MHSLSKMITISAWVPLEEPRLTGIFFVISKNFLPLQVVALKKVAVIKANASWI